MAGVFAGHQMSILIRFVSRNAATGILDWRVWNCSSANFAKAICRRYAASIISRTSYRGPVKTPACGYLRPSHSRLQDTTTRFLRSSCGPPIPLNILIRRQFVRFIRPAVAMRFSRNTRNVKSPNTNDPKETQFRPTLVPDLEGLSNILHCMT